MPSPEDGNLVRRTTLITGGAGFLGSHLCDRLLGEGHEVICLDNLVTGRMENIRHLEQNPAFAFAHNDVTQPIDLTSLLKISRNGFLERHDGRVKLDYVLHLASPASPKDYERYPIPTLRAGAWGTWHALEVARTHECVFLLASSSEVYGDPEVNPQPETYWGHVNPIGPRSVYDEAKRFAEALTMAYHRDCGLKVRIARIFNTYGERMRTDDGRAIPNFLTQALKAEPLTVYGDGSQTRSFCYVSDLVEGICQLLVFGETGPVNLGNPEEVSVLDLAKKIIDLTGSPSDIVFKPLPLDDPAKRRPDITRAMTSLGWRPRVSLYEGLKRVLPYFKTRLEGLWAH
ncbi:MAG TPA: UDP-glucuronic acid decarboxylase family protein [Terriglobia bacterium]|jgi:dTDP-glucose 4,6-dehydratase|nr:UDP-glucuronic acid decarboxylase family protein [Terriglobia bacterium]